MFWFRVFRPLSDVGKNDTVITYFMMSTKIMFWFRVFRPFKLARNANIGKIIFNRLSDKSNTLIWIK